MLLSGGHIIFDAG